MHVMMSICHACKSYVVFNFFYYTINGDLHFHATLNKSLQINNQVISNLHIELIELFHKSNENKSSLYFYFTLIFFLINI